jgi:uncharacterized protein YbjT (DUF2867 family)
MKRVCVLGGSGFVGQSLCKALVDRGWLVRVPSRQVLDSIHPLRALPGVETRQCDIHDPSVLREQFASCDAVINLVGILNEHGSDGSGFRHAHVELTRKVIRACEENDIPRLLHMSALHADAKRGPSHYLYSKGQAEELLLDAGNHGLAVTRFCPSIIFGPGDSFFNRFASLLRFAPIFPLACPNTRFAPVYVEDVARAFAMSLEDDETIGERYELCGPNVYTLRELVTYTAKTCGMKRLILGLNDTASSLQARMLGLLPGQPMTYDNYLSLTVDSVCEKGFPLRFGLAIALEEIVPGYLCKA